MTEQAEKNAPAPCDAGSPAAGPEQLRRLFARRGAFAGFLRAMWSGVERRPDLATRLADAIRPAPRSADDVHVRRWAGRWDIALPEDRCRAFLAVCEAAFAWWVRCTTWCLAACRWESCGGRLPEDAWHRLIDPAASAAWESGAASDPCAEALGTDAPLFAVLDPEGRFSAIPEVWDAGVSASAAICLEHLRGVCARHVRGTPRPVFCDWWRPAYEACFPKPLRLARGEFYTPPWLAEHVLREAGYRDRPGATLLDPSCGSGAFLLAALRVTAAAASQDRPEAILRLLRDRSLRGIDCRPLAVLMARANYLSALIEACMAEASALPASARPRIEASWRPPIHRADLWELAAPGGGEGSAVRRLPDGFVPPGGFDFVVGNPPWLMWDRLEDAERRRLLPILNALGELDLTAREFRHGGAKRDLAGLVVRFCAERLTAENGCAAMVIPLSLWGNPAAGRGFRRWLSARPDRLRASGVDDLSAAAVFPGTNRRTAVVYITKGGEGNFAQPILRYRRWLPARGGRGEASGRDRARRPDSPGRFRIEARTAALAEIAAHPPAGAALPRELAEIARRWTPACDYTAYLGANTGGANGVYWLRLLERDGRTVRAENLPERGRLQVPRCRIRLEAELLFPLLRWQDVREYAATPSLHLLMVQDPLRRTGLPEETLAREYPLTHDYLRRFEALLRGRAAYRKLQSRGPWYSLYNIGRYTLAAHKAVWPRMDRRIRAAAVGPIDDPILGPRPVIPQESCAFIPADSPEEARYLAVLLNGPAGRLLSAMQLCRGGKGFGSPGMIRTWPLPRYCPENPRHREAADAYPADGTPSRAADYAAGAVLGWTRGEVDRIADALDRWES